MERPYKNGQKLMVDPPLRGVLILKNNAEVVVSIVRVVFDDGSEIVVKPQDDYVELKDVVHFNPAEGKIRATPIGEGESCE